jgi:hypothetical protein
MGHCRRTGDRIAIAGGVADYADWNERDHAALRRR